MIEFQDTPRRSFNITLMKWQKKKDVIPFLWSGIFIEFDLFFMVKFFLFNFIDTKRNIPLYKTVVFFCVIPRSLHIFLGKNYNPKNFVDQSFWEKFSVTFFCAIVNWRHLRMQLKGNSNLIDSQKLRTNRSKICEIYWLLLALKKFFFSLSVTIILIEKP